MFRAKDHSKKFIKTVSFFCYICFIIASFPLRAQICDFSYEDTDQFTWGLVPKLYIGNVKVVSRTSYRLLPNGSGVKKGEMMSKNNIYWDNDRKQVLDSLIRPKLTNVKTVVTYDSSRNMTEVKCSHFDGKPVTRFTYKYNSGNKVTELCKYSANDSLENKSILTYDANGNVIENKYFDSNKKWDFKITYKYDSRDNETEEWWHYYKNDSLQGYKIMRKYDANNNMTSEDYYYNKDQKTWRSTFEYDRDNYKTVCIKYDTKDSVIGKETYIYNAGHKMIEQKIYGNNLIISKCTRAYDDHGNITEAASYGANGKVHTIYNLKYTYDTTGNCTSMTTYVNGKPKAITEWVITYW